MNLQNMKDSIRSIQVAFCQELTTAWLDAIMDNPTYYLDIKKFDSLRYIISEVKELRYEFSQKHDPI
jgi:hypothetical protein